MFQHRITLFNLLGFAVRVDASWIFIALLVTWSLASGFFPALHQGASAATYWGMGIAGALGLFASIIFHELSHSVVGRRYGLPIQGITLFIFGGVAEMEDEPPSAKAEFLMAIAGPAASYVLAVTAWLLLRVGGGLGWGPLVTSVLYYLAVINFLLATFNLIPAFPLDGGRVLRAVLWHFKGRMGWATRVASNIGSGFGFALIGLGVVSFIAGNLVGGIWWVMIGLFLRASAAGSYQRLQMRRVLGGEPISRFMTRDPVSVEPNVSLQTFVDEYVYRHHFKMFPVTREGRLVGCITTDQVREVPRQQWAFKTVGDLAGQCGPDNTVGPESDAMQVLSGMSAGSGTRRLVVQNGQLVGIVALRDLLQFLQLKIDMEQ